MIKDFKNKNSDGRLLIKKCFFGLGFHIDDFFKVNPAKTVEEAECKSESKRKAVNH